MPSFSTTRRVPFTPEQMYGLVADVERYPEFLPMCTGLAVSSRTRVPDGEDLIARMSVGYKTISESFMTSVRLRPQKLKVEANYLDGPFKRLENRWQFTDATVADGGGGCDVDFFIDYEFKSPILGLLVGSAFDQAFRKFAEAFELRARQVYGGSASANT
jgi:coenzyme Q-binding protein COQ10